MAKALSNISCVEPFTLEEGENLHKKWLIWKEELDIYIVAAGVTDKKQQKALLLHLGGRELREIYKTLKEENDDYANICTKLETYFQPRKNITYERFKFKQARQEKDENIPSYITRLKNLALHCEFANTDEEVRDSVVATCNSNHLKKKYLSEKNLTLEKVLSMGKEYEAVLSQVQEMESKNATDNIEDETVMKINKSGKYSHKKNFKSHNNQSSKSCFKCGENFTSGHLSICPAKGRKCYNCGKFDHLSKVCRSRKQSYHQQNSSHNTQNFHSRNKPPSNHSKSHSNGRNINHVNTESEESSEEEILSIQRHCKHRSTKEITKC